MLKFCPEHWNALRKAVSDRGMDHLVARDGRQAAEDVKAQLEGRDTVENWDPLMAAHWNILSKVSRAAGIGAMFGEDPHCPLCMVQESYDSVVDLPRFNPDLHKDSEFWVNSCMDAMLDYAREKGLMPGVQ